MDTSMLTTAAGDRYPDDGVPRWREAIDPRGMWVTLLIALAGTVAVVVLTAATLRLVTGG